MPTGLASKAWQGAGWRAVEAQHKNATLALVMGNTADQAILESLIEEAKPALPADAVGLHWLLSTPFRYLPPPPRGSRFRGRSDPGVFYGAENLQTACAEAGYWRLRFWMDSEGLSSQHATMQMTLFEFHGATPLLLDLTEAPQVALRAQWTDPDHYTETQALAVKARAEGIEVIRSESVRHGPDGRCLSILSPRVFRSVDVPYRGNMQTWNLFIKGPELTVWQRQVTGEVFEFRYD